MTETRDELREAQRRGPRDGEGRLIAVVGPSGAGKDTLLEAAKAARPDLYFVRRVITRPTEAGGEDYDGVTDAEFSRRLERGAFAFHWRAHGLSYGVPADIDDLLASGRDVVFNGSRAALPGILARYPNLRVVLVTAPNAVLADRLARRGRETRAEIEARLSRSKFETREGAVVVVNDGTVEDGVARFLNAISPGKKRAFSRGQVV
jgi:ribose 1,5-bisphosphokinase